MAPPGPFFAFGLPQPARAGERLGYYFFTALSTCFKSPNSALCSIMLCRMTLASVSIDAMRSRINAMCGSQWGQQEECAMGVSRGTLSGSAMPNFKPPLRQMRRMVIPPVDL